MILDNFEAQEELYELMKEMNSSEETYTSLSNDEEMEDELLF